MITAIADPLQFERIAVSLAQALLELPPEMRVELKTEHRFTEGLYIREMRAPAGSLIIGHLHRDACPNFILKGKILVVMNGSATLAQAGDTVISCPFVRKLGQVLEDCVWTTVHANPDNCTDIATLEARLLDLESAKVLYPEELAHARALVGTLIEQPTKQEILS